MANGDGNWKSSRIWSHARDVAFLSSFLILTAVPVLILKGLKRFFDEPDLWDMLSFIDKVGTVVVFVMFWAAIILRLAAELRIRKGGDAPSGQTEPVPNK
jgi:hypothetical protein